MISPILVLIFVWFLPTPTDLSINAWHYLAIFLAVIIGLILEPIPAALVGVIGVALVALIGLVRKNTCR